MQCLYDQAHSLFNLLMDSSSGVLHGRDTSQEHDLNTFTQAHHQHVVGSQRLWMHVPPPGDLPKRLS